MKVYIAKWLPEKEEYLVNIKSMHVNPNRVDSVREHIEKTEEADLVWFQGEEPPDKFVNNMIDIHWKEYVRGMRDMGSTDLEICEHLDSILGKKLKDDTEWDGRSSEELEKELEQTEDRMDKLRREILELKAQIDGHVGPDPGSADQAGPNAE